MTHSTTDRVPGTFLLKVARVIFDETVLANVVVPTIADLQREVATASTFRDQVAARWRGYAAFWMLVVVAPVAFIGWQPVRTSSTVSPVMSIGVGMLVVLAFTPAGLRGWVLMSIAGGTLIAIVLHMWHARHPTHIVVPESEIHRRPEINLSSIPVQANIGGLIFMVGSVFIVIAGLPSWYWFFLVAAVGGVLTGAAIFAWHARHPSRGLPQNRISLH